MTEARSATRASRQLSVDVLRGITVAGMLLVNDPGDMGQVFAPLRHSTWHGWTPADLVFPFFLFLVGITTQFSLSRREANGEHDGAMRRAAWRRAAILFGIGLLLNAFPFFEKSAVAGPAWLPPALGHIVARFAHVRIMGVLQRIAVTYLAAWMIARKASSRTVAIVAAVLLIGYSLAMTVLPVPGEGAIGAALLDQPARTLAAWIDRTLLDWTPVGLGWHLWDPAVPYDPEGVASTVPAIATVLLGVLAGRWMQTPRTVAERMTGLGAAGALAMTAGSMWGWTFPINKPLWTSSYVLFTAGTACLALATVGWLVDVARRTRWAEFFLVFGTNPILAYVGGEFLATVLRSSIKWKLDGRRIGTELAVTRLLERAGIDGYLASATWAVAYVVLWYFLLRPLYRRGRMLRV